MGITAEDPRIALYEQIKGHERGGCACANSIGTEYGWGSSPGRLVDGGEFLNSLVAMRLDDDLADDRIRLPERLWNADGYLVSTPTPAAAAMIEHEHRRPSRRLVPMPAATRTAVMAYLDEREALFTRARDLLRNRHRRRCVERDLKRVARLRSLLAGESSLKAA